MLNKLLDHIKIVDFTTRLPGPLSTKILESFGAEIIKIEKNGEIGDPFNDPELFEINPCFKDWYQNLNSHKNIIQLDFIGDQDKIIEICKDADIYLIPDHPKFLDFTKTNPAKVTITLSGGQGQWRSLHDLNALSMSQTFKLHLEDSTHPPYLPFAGIAYGQFLATAAMAALVKHYQTKKTLNEIVYLKEVTEFIFNSFESDSFKKLPRQLHNGAFPAYSLYKTKDNKTVCLAAIEKKHWDNLLKCFNLKLKTKDRFNTDRECFEILENLFANLDASVIKEKIKHKDLCLTVLA